MDESYCLHVYRIKCAALSANSLLTRRSYQWLHMNSSCLTIHYLRLRRQLNERLPKTVTKELARASSCPPKISTQIKRSFPPDWCILQTKEWAVKRGVCTSLYLGFSHHLTTPQALVSRMSHLPQGFIKCGNSSLKRTKTGLTRHFLNVYCSSMRMSTPVSFFIQTLQPANHFPSLAAQTTQTESPNPIDTIPNPPPSSASVTFIGNIWTLDIAGSAFRLHSIHLPATTTKLKDLPFQSAYPIYCLRSCLVLIGLSPSIHLCLSAFI